MNYHGEHASRFQGYDYKDVIVANERSSLYLDCYESFGWSADNHMPMHTSANRTTIRLKRNRSIINKMELTRLERQFEACISEIDKLEKSKTTKACIIALLTGLIGTVFTAGSTFAVTHDPPIIWLCAILAIPGFSGWISAYFIYKHLVVQETKRLQPLIEGKYDELYAICEKGHSLL